MGISYVYCSSFKGHMLCHNIHQGWYRSIVKGISNKNNGV